MNDTMLVLERRNCASIILIDRATDTYIGTRGATGVLSPKKEINIEGR